MLPSWTLCAIMVPHLKRSIRTTKKRLRKETAHWRDIWNGFHLGNSQLCQDALCVYEVMSSRRANRDSFYTTTTNICVAWNEAARRRNFKTSEWRSFFPFLEPTCHCVDYIMHRFIVTANQVKYKVDECFAALLHLTHSPGFGQGSNSVILL